MQGHIKRRAASAQALSRVSPEPIESPVCALCGRPIPRAQRDAHHLVPKSRGGVKTVWLHRVCHRQVHAQFTETELARSYASAEALRAHPVMAHFLAWVGDKPPDFNPPIRRSRSKGLREEGVMLDLAHHG
jgi:hypothetical protein